MSFPRLVREALLAVGIPDTGRLTDEAACEGSKHHSPTPLMVREVELSPAGGGSAAMLCGTCADNLAVLQHLLNQHDGALSWPVRRSFGNLIRALAERGWTESPAGSGRNVVSERSQQSQVSQEGSVR